MPSHLLRRFWLRHFFLFSAFIFGIVDFSIQSLHADLLTEDQYQGIKSVSLMIATKYPLDSYIIIGIGRSPTPITAFLEAMNPGSAFDIPLSHFRYVRGDTRKGLSFLARRKLFKHLETFLPSPDQIQGKTLLFIDYAQGGDTLFSFKEYMDAYLKSRARTLSYEILPISSQYYLDKLENNAKLRKAELKRCLLITDRSLEDAVNRGKWKNYSKFPRFNPNDKIQDPLLPRPEYEILKAEFERRSKQELFSSDHTHTTQVAQWHELNIQIPNNVTSCLESFLKILFR